ncbi:hypothetical protein D3C72_715590 [compost metagenome]
MIPFQRAPYPPMTPALFEACHDAVHVLTSDGRVLRAGRAVLYLFEFLGWRRLAWFLALPPMLAVVELGYRFVANNRRYFANVFSLAEDPEQLAYEGRLLAENPAVARAEIEQAERHAEERDTP